MANLKSSKKRAKQMAGRHHKNLARKTAIKTAMNKVLRQLNVVKMRQQPRRSCVMQKRNWHVQRTRTSCTKTPLPARSA